MESKRASFLAVKEFIAALAPLHDDQNKLSPFNVYLKLVRDAELKEKTVVIRTLKGFDSFFKKNKNYKTSIPAGAKIAYKTQDDLMFIPIGKIFAGCSQETRTIIQQHLTAIHACMFPTEQNLQELSQIPTTPVTASMTDGIEGLFDSVDTSLPEGRFLQRAVNSLKGVVEGMPDPGQGGEVNFVSVAASLFTNPSVVGLFAEMNAEFTSGNLRLDRLVTAFGPQGQQMMNSIGNPAVMASLGNMVSQAVPQAPSVEPVVQPPE